MWISNVKIKNFRNYTDENISLNKNINIFYGENAQGKTNIIESIFLCGMGKSFRAKKDGEMINFDSQNSSIEVEFQKSDRDGKIKIELGTRKNIYLNGIKLKKLSELIGNINLVIFTPDDINILRGSPQERRRFLDIMISQLRPNYLNCLMLYLKTLEQRNNYLKQIKEDGKDESLLDIWDEKLADYAVSIYKYRFEFINKLQEKIEKIHEDITENKEKIVIEYVSMCEEKNLFLKALKERRKLDIIKGFTTRGVHRDDFKIYINEKEVDIYGSQGQNRTAMLSLKLAELKVVYDEIGEEPILLLDDFMSELDSKRRKSFLENIGDTQVIITCTEKFTLENLKTFSYNVKSGKIYKD
ncbi:MAG: DNA replication/repair protein RecF [Clostridia bacterium]|nr:DNA replication/repair protein RecF [Clostridia bacterium]